MHRPALFLFLYIMWLFNKLDFGVEIEMMKERFSKLLLGEDMSGCGNGVCTALAISNAITNLCGMLLLLSIGFSFNCVDLIYGD